MLCPPPDPAPMPPEEGWCNRCCGAARCTGSGRQSLQLHLPGVRSGSSSLRHGDAGDRDLDLEDIARAPPRNQPPRRELEKSRDSSGTGTGRREIMPETTTTPLISPSPSLLGAQTGKVPGAKAGKVPGAQTGKIVGAKTGKVPGAQTCKVLDSLEPMRSAASPLMSSQLATAVVQG